MNINIGGGAGWDYAGWKNFDQREGFRFGADTVFPVEDASADYVYSSHCLEHLDDATVDQVLREARRMGRTFVLKLPDFEEVLKRWRAGDRAYFDHWGMGKVVKTWKNMRVEDTIDARASMIFCGWWNDAYGDEWGSRNPDAPGAYHGPVPNAPHALILDTYTPSGVAANLSPYAEGGHFNHRNAWSRAELAALLERHGFTVEHMDAERACLLPIPTITDQRGISMYAVAH